MTTKEKEGMDMVEDGVRGKRGKFNTKKVESAIYKYIYYCI